MRRLIIAGFAVCQLVGTAGAAAICATPQELKVLQAAALQQQLTAAALTCHDNADYGRFVSTYHSALLGSDRALKQFFQRNKGSEGYEAYKARIAKAVSLQSLHDARFCESARRVFDLALQRGAPGKAPLLVATGYESCRPVSADWALQLAKKPPHPVAQPPQPPSAAEHALALIPAPRPRLAALRAKPPGTRMAQAVLKLVPPPPAVKAVAAPPSRVAAARFESVRAEPSGGNIPNAYMPGAYWVLDGADEPPPPSWIRDEKPFLGPDGRWYVPTDARAN